MPLMKPILVIFFTFALNTPLLAEVSAEQSTEKYFQTIMQDPAKLERFLYKMPKGGDLHIHHAGAGFAENMIKYAKGSDLCVNDKTFTLSWDKSCLTANRITNIEQVPEFYDAVIDAWSMRHFKPGKESGHDHFFATFAKYRLISKSFHQAIALEIIERAAMQNESYVELMVTLDNAASSRVGEKIGWQRNLGALRQKLLSGGLKPIIKKASRRLDAENAYLKRALRCGTATAKIGCDVTLRYLYQVAREKPPAAVFAQLVSGFEIAKQDARVLGINMAQPEDGMISMRDYSLHMRMVQFLRPLYPTVKVSLHAGELIPNLVPDAGLRFHILEAVEIAGTDRIGHGVDIAHENNRDTLLRKMAKKGILVEINLSSNEMILGVAGKEHPLPLYMHYGVPVALSTDDEGVNRANLTEQYKKAVLTYQFNYLQIKNMVRNSLNYSFLPGESLWADSRYQHIAGACAKDSFDTLFLSKGCANFLKYNEKANVQWTLENRFLEFEGGYSSLRA